MYTGQQVEHRAEVCLTGRDAVLGWSLHIPGLGLLNRLVKTEALLLDCEHRVEKSDTSVSNEK